MNNKIHIFIILILFSISYKSFSQHNIHIPSKKAQKEFELAKNYYSKENLSKALATIDNCITIDSLFVQAYILKANILTDLQNFCEALVIFEKAAEIENVNYVGNLFDQYRFSVECGDYQKAMNKLLLMKQDTDKKRFPDNYIDSLIKTTDIVIDIMNNPLFIEKKKIESPVNSDINEYVTAISSDEKKLFFTRSYIDTTYFDDEPIIRIVDEIAYIAERQSIENSDIWDTVYKFENFYPQFGDGLAVTISPDGNTIFFVGCGWNDSYGSCDIYCSRKIGNEWTNPINLGSGVNSKYWDSQPYMSSDGFTLYFVSNRPGGYGKSDIWYSVMNEDGIFGEAKNLGKRVNTSGYEQTPFIHFDARTLYFSSDGHPGLGGTDLFKIDLKNPDDKAVNLGYPINDKNDQQCFLVTPDGRTAYVSSVNENGNFDIFYYTIPKHIRPNPVIYMEEYVFDPIAGEQTKIEFYPLEQGKDIIVRNIVFEHDSYKLENVSYNELNRIVSMMNKNPDINFEIRGHTDNTGIETYNLTLSENRAKVVYEYLISKGINPSRLSYNGYGSKYPISDNNTEEGRALNRR
ncbi:OmpA family protein, partial [Odoribacter sp. OttesenSCG-928-L07]|nr:OmpA family protein [Odoribacter sp. OttesenSCG-928-L07]